MCRVPMATGWLVKFVLSWLVRLTQRIKASYLRDVRRGRLHPDVNTVP